MKDAIFGVVVVLMVVSSAAGHENKSSAKGTSFLTCWNEAFEEYHSRSARSLDYVAPNGQSRAYSSVRAKALAGNSGDCENESTLFVSKDGRYRAVLKQTVSDAAGQGNGIQIIQWSADSKRLLADMMTWHYYSEDMKHHAIIYTVSDGTVQNLDLDKLFSRHTKQDCELGEARIRGFASDGSVILEAWPMDEVYGGTSCVPRQSMWRLRPSVGELSQLPSTFKWKRHEP